MAVDLRTTGSYSGVAQPMRRRLNLVHNECHLDRNLDYTDPLQGMTRKGGRTLVRRAILVVKANKGRDWPASQGWSA